MEIRITFDLTDRLADMLERGLDLIEDQATQPTALIADDNADDAALQAKYDAEYRDSPVFRNGDDHLELPSGFQETIDRASDKGDDGLEEARDYDYDHSLPVVVDDTDKLDALDDRRKDDLAPAVTIPTPAVKPKKKQAKIHTFDCAHCGASFSTAKRKARYCSQDCYFAQKRAG